jgi:hypothetical protein
VAMSVRAIDRVEVKARVASGSDVALAICGEGGGETGLSVRGDFFFMA